MKIAGIYNKSKVMKKQSVFILMLVSVSMIYAQESQETRQEKKEAREAELIQRTNNLVKSGEWQFDATFMTPASGRGRSLTSPYRVIVKNGQADSYLPYFGRAYKAEYGNTSSPLSFRGEISDLSVKDWKKGGWVISFTTVNGSDRLDYTFHIAETGSATLMVNSTNRQPISFSGDLTEIESRK